MAVLVRPSAREVLGEIPSGPINGFNLVFTTTLTFRFGSTRVYLNGVRQKLGASFDYVENGTADSITFSVAPKTGDHILIDYLK